MGEMDRRWTRRRGRESPRPGSDADALSPARLARNRQHRFLCALPTALSVWLSGHKQAQWPAAPLSFLSLSACLRLANALRLGLAQLLGPTVDALAVPTPAHDCDGG
jgi:hypothetical protein